MPTCRLRPLPPAPASAHLPARPSGWRQETVASAQPRGERRSRSCSPACHRRLRAGSEPRVSGSGHEAPRPAAGRPGRPACVLGTVSLVRLSGAASCHWTGHLSVSLGRCSGPRGHTGGCPLAEREAGCSLALKSNLALSFCLRERGAFSQARYPGSGGEEGGRAGSLLAEASPSRGSQEGGALGWPPDLQQPVAWRSLRSPAGSSVSPDPGTVESALEVT